MPAAKAPAKKAAKKSPPAKKAAAKAPAERMTVAEVMKILEKNGTAQTKKTYMRHGAKEPLYGVLFGFLKKLQMRIRVDHELALGLWKTGNFDARNLAFKIVDPARITPADLDRWGSDTTARMCSLYVSSLAVESPHGKAKAAEWLRAADEERRCSGWGVVGQLAARDESLPDAWFAEKLDAIAKTIHAAPNYERSAMNGALIAIGGRSPALRKAALGAAKRIGRVEVDHGDTFCKTPDAAEYIAKMWKWSDGKGFASPSAQERARESLRTRC